MRAVSVIRRLLSFLRLSVKKVRFETDEFGDPTLVAEVAVRGRSRCSRCSRKCPRYDQLEPRRWRHLDFGIWRVYLEAQLWRVDCSCCGVVVEEVTWADPASRFTKPFEDLVTWLAQRSDKTTISTMLRIAWRSVGRIIERVVTRRREPVDWTKVTAIAVDELSFRKGQRYITLVYDLDAGRVLWSKEGRSKATLEAFFAEIGPEACARIRHAAIDMFEAYAQAIQQWLPNATLIYDRFHVQQLASKAMDEVRRAEWRRLRGTEQGRAIKHTRWALLRNPWNVTPKEHERLSALPKQNRILYRGYLLKERSPTSTVASTRHRGPSDASTSGSPGLRGRGSIRSGSSRERSAGASTVCSPTSRPATRPGWPKARTPRPGSPRGRPTASTPRTPSVP